jgi:hypothetical protein
MASPVLHPKLLFYWMPWRKLINFKYGYRYANISAVYEKHIASAPGRYHQNAL